MEPWKTPIVRWMRKPILGNVFFCVFQISVVGPEHWIEITVCAFSFHGASTWHVWDAREVWPTWHECIHALTHSFINLFIHKFISSFICSFILSCMRSFMNPAFVHSLVYSFTHSSLLPTYTHTDIYRHTYIFPYIHRLRVAKTL